MVVMVQILPSNLSSSKHADAIYNDEELYDTDPHI